MDISWHVSVAGAIVGFVVGLTGMGGGALMTPILVIFFNVQPLAAVSSDLVASLIMKPVGAGVHWRAKTVKTPLVKWLCLGFGAGGVRWRAAITGVTRRHEPAGADQAGTRRGAAARGRWHHRAVRARRPPQSQGRRLGESHRRRAEVPTILIGLVGGLVVGMTSVGSGSLMIVLLMLLYPALSMRELVGTDLVQALPLVGSAALGQAIFGDVRFGLTTSLIVGAVPAVYVGARLSSRAPSWFVRRGLAVVLLASALKLLDVPSRRWPSPRGVARSSLAVVSAVPEIRSTTERRRARREMRREAAASSIAA